MIVDQLWPTYPKLEAKMFEVFFNCSLKEILYLPKKEEFLHSENPSELLDALAAHHILLSS